MKTIIVCGAGTMGTGIAETAARSGYTTVLYEPRAEALQKAELTISRNLQQLVDKDKIGQQEMKDALTRISFTSELEHCKGDVVIEAIIEKQLVGRGKSKRG